MTKAGSTHRPPLGYRASILARVRCGAPVAITLVVAALSAHGNSKTPIVVPDRWIERKCLDYGNRDIGVLSQAEFEACIRKMVSGYPKLDVSRREHFGELYDPEQYVKCRVRHYGTNTSSCDVHILRRREWPEYWPEGAKRVKWPDAPSKSVYRRGMKPKEYWEALCKAEGGETVNRAAKDVEGVFELRPRSFMTDYERVDRYVLEGAFLSTDILSWPEPEQSLVQPYGGKYLYIERGGRPGGGEVTAISRMDPAIAKERWQTGREGRFVTIPKVLQRHSSPTYKATYAYTWRGISRERDRENGISGGEMIVVDLQSGEILGIRRGFALSGQGRSGQVSWSNALLCPSLVGAAPNANFLYRVLKPRADVNQTFYALEK